MLKRLAIVIALTSSTIAWQRAVHWMASFQIADYAFSVLSAILATTLVVILLQMCAALGQDGFIKILLTGDSSLA